MSEPSAGAVARVREVNSLMEQHVERNHATPSNVAANRLVALWLDHQLELTGELGVVHNVETAELVGIGHRDTSDEIVAAALAFANWLLDHSHGG